MSFKEIPPKWDAQGAEPGEELQTKGFIAGYKPPAPHFNYMFHKYTESIKELQANLDKVNNTADTDKPISTATQEALNDLTDTVEKNANEAAEIYQTKIIGILTDKLDGWNAEGLHDIVSNIDPKHYGMAYGNGKFVIVAKTYDGCVLKYSYDGINWIEARGIKNDAYLLSVTYGKGKFVAVGHDAYYSEDGVTWKEGSIDSSQDLYDVTYGERFVGVDYGGKFVAVGGHVGSAYYSDDGITWTKGSGISTDDELHGVTYGKGRFVAVGEIEFQFDDYDGHTFYYSDDGINWTKGSGIGYGQSVIYANNIFVAVGEDCASFYSEDGITWKEGIIERTNEYTDLKSVAYGNGKFVAVGLQTNKTYYYSDNGITWTKGSAESDYLRNITYGNGRFVAITEHYSYCLEFVKEYKSLEAEIEKKANADSPALTGKPTAPTPDSTSNDTQVATTAFVKALINALINGAPATMDTLKEVADAIANNDDVVAALNAAIGNKANADGSNASGTWNINIDGYSKPVIYQKGSSLSAVSYVKVNNIFTSVSSAIISSIGFLLNSRGTDTIQLSAGRDDATVVYNARYLSNAYGKIFALATDGNNLYVTLSAWANRLKIQQYMGELNVGITMEEVSSLPSGLTSIPIAEWSDISHTHSGYAPTDSPVFTGSISMGRVEGTKVGKNSVAIGNFVIAAGDNSFAQGPNAYAEGDSSAAFCGGHAKGRSSFAAGYNALAEELCAIAFGNDVTAKGCQMAIGRFNDVSLAYGSSNSSGPGSATAFVIGNGDKDYSNAFRINYNGETYAKGAYNTTGADYAEFAEWADGNTDNEDRRGYFVTFDEEKPKMIRKANEGDYILGIISGNPCIIGNSDEGWLGKYIFDEFGAYVYEEKEVEIEYIDEETGETKTKTELITTYKTNPDYDPEQKYIHRKDRPEWDYVGWMGVLSVRDDNTCVPGGYCKVANGGIATTAERGIDTYRVLERVTDNIVKVVLK